MFDIFSTREIASAIYILLLIIWLSTRKNGIKSLLGVLGAVCKPIIIFPILFLFAFAAIVVYGLQFFPFWNWILLKDVILWVLFVATPIFFKAGTRKLDTYPFTQMILDNFLASAILEFFISSFTFSLCAEFVTIPVFTFITILKDYNRDNPKHKKHQKVYDGFAIFAGLILLFFTAKIAIDVIASEGIIPTLISFCIPVMFSVAFLPVIYSLALWAQYHDLFVRMYIRNHLSKKGLFPKKFRVFLACGFSYKKLLSFRTAYTNYITSIRSANDDDTFLSFVAAFKKESH